MFSCHRHHARVIPAIQYMATQHENLGGLGKKIEGVWEIFENRGKK
jgi:hypothetical protein